jgi:uncharacterized membrane protein
VIDRVFDFLFKYPRVVFEQAEFRWITVSQPVLLILAVAGALALAALITFRGIMSDGRRRDRLAFVALRLVGVALLLFCLVRPVLVLKAAVPQQNFLGVLLDDSQSMTIADTGGRPRTDFIQQQFADANSPLMKALSSRFVIRLFKFSTAADRLGATSELKYDGTSTRLGRALEHARDELSGLPLAGVVMVSDGADTSEATLDESLAGLKARSIPVFTVGLGQDRFSKDIEISRVETPRTTLKGTSLSVDVVIRQTGYGGATVPLTVEDEGRVVSSQQVTLPADGESATVRVTFTAADAGARLFRFRVPPQTAEQVTQNNQRDALVEVSDRREKVLYLEGEPRFEMKFIRRAVSDDDNLDVVILQRTAEDKYLRLGVGSPDELVGGFPKTREELFAYRAIILGSVEAASFSPDQLRMLADFVSKRGGGLLMLGGRRSFVEGGWAGTPVAEVLPVEFNSGGPRGETPRGENAKDFFTHVTVKPTRAGQNFPVVQLADDESSSVKRWDDLPAVSAVNAITQVKAGATVLLNGTDDRKENLVVLAFQRYGRGKALAFPVQDSWIWKMDATIPVDDTTHATFWRRLVRWLVDGVPDQVSVTTAVDRVEPGEAMKLTAAVLDPAYVEVNNAQVLATVTSPTGKVTEVPLQWTVTRDGEYEGTYVPDEAGRYEVKASAQRDGTTLGNGSMHARASAGDNEYFDAAMRSTLLQRIAEETGGRFFTPDSASSLPQAISYSGRGVTLIEERDLWDMPIVLILLLSVIAADWGLRRKLGLA